jgi:hypothetical protein
LIWSKESEQWFESLGSGDKARFTERLDHLREHGPDLGRPSVDRVKSSRHHNMKELRSKGRHLRLLFAFDNRRAGVLLVGGDKENNWERWYRENIPKADRLFDEHLRRSEGRGPCRGGGSRPDGPIR